MPGVWHQQSVSRDMHYGAYGEYRRFEQSGHVPPPEDNVEDAKVFFEGVVMLLAVGSFVW